MQNFYWEPQNVTPQVQNLLTELRKAGYPILNARLVVGSIFCRCRMILTNWKSSAKAAVSR